MKLDTVTRSCPARTFRRELAFHRTLRQAFELMRCSPEERLPMSSMPPEVSFYNVFPKLAFREPVLSWQGISDLLNSPQWRPAIFEPIQEPVYLTSNREWQIEETLINALYWGGTAVLVMARLFSGPDISPPRRTWFISDVQMSRRSGKIYEVTVWDNGPGINDLRWALQPKVSSRAASPNVLAGRGLGIDAQIADELIIKTGRQIASRLCGSTYHLFKKGNNVPGTRVTLRFWLEETA
jgi:hypothetical protein